MNEWSDQSTNAYPVAAPSPAPQAGPPNAYPVTAGQPAPLPPSRRPRRRWGAVAVVAALMLAAILVGVAIGNVVWGTDAQLTAQHQTSSVNDSTGTNDVPSDDGTGLLPYDPSQGDGSPYGDGSSVASSALSDVAEGLVYINVTIGSQGAHGAGTGIVLTSDGKVLTNNHIVNGATDISATTLADGETYDVEVLGYDRTEDVALVQLEDASELETAPIGSSSSVTVGDAIVTMGNAGGDGGEPSASEGSVTALDQTITASDQDGSNAEQLDGLIQNDANVQSGDSGGALIDDSGEVIGMNTAGSAGNAYGQAVPESYAVPIDTALAIADQIDSGQSSDTVHVGPTAFLGVAISDGGATSGSYGSPYGGSSGESPYGDAYGRSLRRRLRQSLRRLRKQPLRRLVRQSVRRADRLVRRRRQRRPVGFARRAGRDRRRRHDRGHRRHRCRLGGLARARARRVPPGGHGHRDLGRPVRPAALGRRDARRGTGRLTCGGSHGCGRPHEVTRRGGLAGREPAPPFEIGGRDAP